MFTFLFLSGSSSCVVSVCDMMCILYKNLNLCTQFNMRDTGLMVKYVSSSSFSNTLSVFSVLIVIIKKINASVWKEFPTIAFLWWVDTYQIFKIYIRYNFLGRITVFILYSSECFPCFREFVLWAKE